jgi:hypothetical protein
MLPLQTLALAKRPPCMDLLNMGASRAALLSQALRRSPILSSAPQRARAIRKVHATVVAAPDGFVAGLRASGRGAADENTPPDAAGTDVAEDRRPRPSSCLRAGSGRAAKPADTVTLIFSNTSGAHEQVSIDAEATEPLEHALERYKDGRVNTAYSFTFDGAKIEQDTWTHSCESLGISDSCEVSVQMRQPSTDSLFHVESGLIDCFKLHYDECKNLSLDMRKLSRLVVAHLKHSPAASMPHSLLDQLMTEQWEEDVEDPHFSVAMVSLALW